MSLQLYTEGGVSSVPQEVELALATGLSLAGQPTKALDLLRKTKCVLQYVHVHADEAWY